MKKFALLLSAIVISTGCAQAEIEKQIDEKLKAEPTVIGRIDLSKEADKLLVQDPAIPGQQKMELRELWQSTKKEMDSMRITSRKLRVLLLQEVVAENPDQKEIDLVKQRLGDVEHQRLAEYFKSVRETNRILGRWGSAADRERFYDMLDFSSRYIRDID